MIKKTDTCSIHFYIAGDNYAFGYRSWPFVPRCGDEIMLGDVQRNRENPTRDGKHPFRITRVVWGVEGPDGHHLGQQAVNIEIEQI